MNKKTPAKLKLRIKESTLYMECKGQNDKSECKKVRSEAKKQLGCFENHGIKLSRNMKRNCKIFDKEP